MDMGVTDSLPGRFPDVDTDVETGDRCVPLCQDREIPQQRCA
jgi:hypothetical protein